MHRAIAKQAEAEREKRGRIIIAEGELTAAEKMSQAADYYTKNMAAMRLRELQTWTEIARERNMIVVTGGGDHTDLGSLLGIIKERTPVSQQFDLLREINNLLQPADRVNLSSERLFARTFDSVYWPLLSRRISAAEVGNLVPFSSAVPGLAQISGAVQRSGHAKTAACGALPA
jgi:hypothetical protein